MTLNTAFTELFSIRHPLALGPMGVISGGRLAAAVSNAGGLGIIGGSRGDPALFEPEIALMRERSTNPWAIGFLAWAVRPEAVEQALSHRPTAVMFNFGNPSPFADLVHRSGSLLIVGVTDLEEARTALAAGADVIVAQGTEAGGHCGHRATLPFVPAVVDLAGSTPVLAAGGIADGRGLAAALVLGAAGAMLGTRFEATSEANIAPWQAKAIVEGRGDDTERSRVTDVWAIPEGPRWPRKWPARTLPNPVLNQWRDREEEFEEEIATNAGAREAYQRADASHDPSVAPVYAGEAIDLITDIVPAADLVEAIVTQAELALATAGRARRDTDSIPS